MINLDCTTILSFNHNCMIDFLEGHVALGCVHLRSELSMSLVGVDSSYDNLGCDPVVLLKPSDEMSLWLVQEYVDEGILSHVSNVVDIEASIALGIAQAGMCSNHVADYLYWEQASYEINSHYNTLDYNDLPF